MKKLFFLTAILAVLGLSSCEKAPSKAIVGTWEAVKAETTMGNIDMTIDMAEMGMTIELTFNEDGTGSAVMKSEEDTETSPFEYEVNENILVLTEDGITNEIPFTIEKDEMTMEIGGEIIEEEGAKIKIYFKKK